MRLESTQRTGTRALLERPAFQQLRSTAARKALAQCREPLTQQPPTPGSDLQRDGKMAVVFLGFATSIYVLLRVVLNVVGVALESLSSTDA